VSRPRYAPARFQLSRQGGIVALSGLALALVLGVPAASRATVGDRMPEAAGAPAAPVAVPAAQPGWLADLRIRPARVSTAQPAAPGAGAAVPGGVFGPAGVTGQLGIPVLVLKAYQQAAATMASEQPSCHLPWWLLAGIGHTESGHAEGGRLYPDGTTRGRILGPVLDGTLADNAVIPDTDHGVYDGDPHYDRAVGPMQFIPSTWALWGVDANHDGKADPNNVFDATLAAGRYLCADNRNLATLPGLQAAVLSYNHSQAYLDTVLAWGMAYRDGVAAVADLSNPVVNDVTKVRPPLSARPPKKPRKVAAPATSSSAKSSAASSSAARSTAASSSAASSTTAASSPASSSPASSSSAATPSASCTTPTATASTTSTSRAAAATAPTSSADGGSASLAGDSAAAPASTAPKSTASSSASSTPTRCAP